MPTYEYACKSCGQHTDVVQSFTDDALTVCTNCGGPLRKVFGNIGIAFKGSGFYKNDSRAAAKGGSRTAASAESGAAAKSSEGSSGGAGESGTSGGESHGNAKDGAKTDGAPAPAAKTDGAKTNGAKSDGPKPPASASKKEPAATT